MRAVVFRRDVTYMDLAIRYVNETAANNDKVEHVPRVAEVVLRDRRRGIEREKRDSERVETEREEREERID